MELFIQNLSVISKIFMLIYGKCTSSKLFKNVKSANLLKPLCQYDYRYMTISSNCSVSTSQWFSQEMLCKYPVTIHSITEHYMKSNPGFKIFQFLLQTQNRNIQTLNNYSEFF